ncbi:MAG: hypothetical protein ABSG61_14205 [Gemmatimonadales bacterium]
MKREFEYYLENQAELVKKHNGKFIVIKNRAVIGDYDDQLTAISETAKTHELGTFLVQKVEPGTDAHTQTFHSRVAFA